MSVKKIIHQSIFIGAVLGGFVFSSPRATARDNFNDWYIQNFESEIVVNKDSSLDITEKITADCGNATGKHGIFRIVPYVINVDGNKIDTPIKLIGITNFNGQPLKYTESVNRIDKTVTWKIGDPNKTVQGVNYYLVHYQVKNAIRFGNSNFDELYWNLTGNFWDIDIDKFHAKVIFPSEINQGNHTLNLYSGYLGAKGNNLAVSQWSAPNILEVDSIQTLLLGQGITISVTFPKNIFIPYVPIFWEKYGQLSLFLLPLFFMVGCFYVWMRFGKDPRLNKTVIPEYKVPQNLSPVEVGMLMSNGSFSNELVTAEIINLAIKKLISIKEVENKILFFHSKDYEFVKHPNPSIEQTLNSVQNKIYENVFGLLTIMKLSSLKNNFYKAVPDIKRAAKQLLEDKKLITSSGLAWRSVLFIAGLAFIFLSFWAISMSVNLWLSLFISGIILFIFSFVMPKRTILGAELNWQTKGFKLFMETVDKDRAKFYEKENIFEKFLPYAIVFGMTDLWIKKMKEIYGEDFYKNYTPVWYSGTLGSFNAESFSSAINSLSSSIAANTSSASGAGGAGGAGGGGGGGGGGGW